MKLLLKTKRWGFCFWWADYRKSYFATYEHFWTIYENLSFGKFINNNINSPEIYLEYCYILKRDNFLLKYISWTLSQNFKIIYFVEINILYYIKKWS